MNFELSYKDFSPSSGLTGATVFAGKTYLGFYQLRNIDKKNRSIEISYLFVEEGFRNLGVGTEVLDRVVKQYYGYSITKACTDSNLYFFISRGFIKSKSGVINYEKPGMELQPKFEFE